jgi:hypothetical protein
MSDNLMHRCNSAPRCRAKSKRTGLPCQSPAVKGYRVCRMHGARGGAPEGKRNGNFRHGGRTKEATNPRVTSTSLSVSCAISNELRFQAAPATSAIGVPAQRVDATQALNLSAGVSNCNARSRAGRRTAPIRTPVRVPSPSPVNIRQPEIAPGCCRNS